MEEAIQTFLNGIKDVSFSGFQLLSIFVAYMLGFNTNKKVYKERENVDRRTIKTLEEKVVKLEGKNN